MELTEQERLYFINFLLKYTSYPKKTIYEIAQNDYKLFNMTQRINDCLDRYPKEIIKYLEEHPEVQERYTLEELRNMTYNDLVDIRKRFKIRKKSKKIVKATIAPEVAKKAREAIKENHALEKTIVLSALSEPEDIEFLTPEEIEMMYPGSGLYSDEELHSLGVARENSHDHREVDPNAYYIKIATIVDSGLMVDGKTPTLQECYDMPVAEVERLYKLALAKLGKKDSKTKKKL